MIYVINLMIIGAIALISMFIILNRKEKHTVKWRKEEKKGSGLEKLKNSFRI